MSIFIAKADYEGHIHGNRLDKITDTTDALLDSAEKEAISYMKGYLSARYDVDAIFSALGDDRDEVILSKALDITLYYLHRRVNHRKVPQHRLDAYREAKEWLTNVQQRMINPQGLPVPADESKDEVLFSSEPKRTNYLK